ncbi:hypothetical protein FRC11_013162 [Ceratobasidium sp. 423]|nr:hypothetical protein FRC11_013162 [Ceratobasidium sp. 423]
MTFRGVPANDIAKISYRLESVAPPYAIPTGSDTLLFEGLEAPVSLKHLQCLLRMMDGAALDYNLLKDNCMVFCQAIIDCMETYQSKAIYLRRPELDQARRQDLKRRFTGSITDLHNYGFTTGS